MYQITALSFLEQKLKELQREIDTFTYSQKFQRLS